jgi:hypothetical protein
MKMQNTYALENIKEAIESVIKITIPIHETLDRGTLKGILRNADLTVDEFVGLL